MSESRSGNDVEPLAFSIGSPRKLYRWLRRFRAADLRPLPLLILITPLGASAQVQHEIYLTNNSDWWSVLRSASFGEGIPGQKREPPAASYRILGINLEEFLPLGQVASKVGPVVEVDRGDAAVGRQQLCYQSTSEGGKVYLIFEQGEVEQSFYLFRGGPAWIGDSACTTSTRVSAGLRSDAGLGLGETRPQVQAILGKPSVRRPDALIYLFTVKKKSSPKDLEAARKGNPEMSEAEIDENYGSYFVWAYIETRFRAQKVAYLAVSLSETY